MTTAWAFVMVLWGLGLGPGVSGMTEGHLLRSGAGYQAPSEDHGRATLQMERRHTETLVLQRSV